MTVISEVKTFLMTLIGLPVLASQILMLLSPATKISRRFSEKIAEQMVFSSV